MNTKLFLATTGNGIARAVPHGDGEWSVEVSLSEQDVRCLAADPLNADVIYAGTQGNGVLRSNDRGQTWQRSGMDGQIVKSLAINPLDPDIIYAGTKPALMFASYDGGNIWTELDGFRRIPNRWWWLSPAEPPDHRPYVFAIAPSPTESEVLLAGVEAGAVVRSDDGGRTWSRHRRGALRDCHFLKFHATNGNWVYEAGAPVVGQLSAGMEDAPFKKPNGVWPGSTVSPAQPILRNPKFGMCAFLPAPARLPPIEKIQNTIFIVRLAKPVGSLSVGWRTPSLLRPLHLLLSPMRQATCTPG